MAQNVTLLGASYSDVPAVLLPKTGGGEALFADPSGVTAQDADVAAGKIYIGADGEEHVGTGSGGGGGGASNIVTGTFKGTTTGTVLEVTIPYTGSGYPVAFIIRPTEGYNSDAPFYNLVQRYAAVQIAGFKRYPNTPPTWAASSTTPAYFVIANTYKSSASTGSTLSNTQSTTATTLTNQDATSTAAMCIRFRSATKMSVFIASTSYGFAANIEYTYHIIYSS